MTFKDELLNNRYLTLKKYRSMSPFFDQELNAHILLKFEEILDFFKQKAISSNRKEKQFENLSGCPFSKDIVSFYGNWLMYMDGEKHLEYRKIISNALSVSMKSIDEYVHSAIEREIKTKFSKIHHNYDLISNISHPFLISVLSELFGIDQSDYEKMINLSKPIVSFISSGTLGLEEDRKNVANSLGITELFLEECIEKCDKENSFIGVLKKENIELSIIKPLLINVLIDGYDPLISVINYYFYILSKNFYIPNEMTSSEIFDELIRLEPSFQYLARIVTDDIDLNGYKINKGERVVAFIPSANRDESTFVDEDKFCIRSKKDKYVSFGIGSHRCLGALLSKRVVVPLIEYITQCHNQIEFELVKDEWFNFIGFSALSKLIVNIKEK